MVAATLESWGLRCAASGMSAGETGAAVPAAFERFGTSALSTIYYRLIRWGCRPRAAFSLAQDFFRFACQIGKPTSPPARVSPEQSASMPPSVARSWIAF
jgi:hypothetical protein